MATAPVKTNQKLLITGIVLALTFGLSLVTWRWTQSLRTELPDSAESKRPSYNQLNIIKDGNVVGIINHKDNTLTYEATDPALQALLMVNLKIWEQQQLEYPTGGRLADGTLWDGSVTTDVHNSDFLLAIWLLLEEKLESGYSFDVQP